MSWHGLQPARLLCPWDSPGKNIGVGCHALFQGFFTTQGLNLRFLCLLYWQVGFYHYRPLGSPNIPIAFDCCPFLFSLLPLRPLTHFICATPGGGSSSLGN